MAVNMDPETVQFFGMLFTFLSLVFTSVFGFYVMQVKWRQDHQSKQIETAMATTGLAVNKVNEVARRVEAGQEARTGALREMAVKVDSLVQTSNGMKDALVAATRKEALAEGHAAGVADTTATIAAVVSATKPP